jgi:hypothetical protein
MNNLLRSGSALALLLIGLAGTQPSIATPTTASAAAYPSAASLLHKSIATITHSVPATHGFGMIRTGGCCPKTPAAASLVGDCMTGPTATLMRSGVSGTMSFDAKSVVAVDFHLILKYETVSHASHSWIRSSATHNTWQVATRKNAPTRDMDLVVYLCPSGLVAQFSQHFPTHLVNLGPVFVRGLPAWHLRDRYPTTGGSTKGMLLQSDFYLARPSLSWLRYGSLYNDGSIQQTVVVDYSRLSRPLTIAAPIIGSSAP